MELLWFILVGLAIGWLASRFMSSGAFGRMGDLAFGAGGAVLGGLMFNKLTGAPEGTLAGALVVASVISFVFLFLLRQFRSA